MAITIMMMLYEQKHKSLKNNNNITAVAITDNDEMIITGSK